MKPPKTRFEAFRINNRISASQLHRAAVLSSRTVDLMRCGSNTTIDSIRSIVRTFSDLLGRDVAVEELFDLSGAHEPQKVVATFDLPGKKRRRSTTAKRKKVRTRAHDRPRRVSGSVKKNAAKVAAKQ